MISTYLRSVLVLLLQLPVYAMALDIPTSPLVGSAVVAPPLNALVLGRDRNLFVEAYDDYTDLDDDGVYDVGFIPTIDYYGYFNPYLCYDYNNSPARFVPRKLAENKKCGGDSWSGNLMNYISMSRVDVLRKALYGGQRVGLTADLLRSRIPTDTHAWGKQLTADLSGRGNLLDYVPENFQVKSLYYCAGSPYQSYLCADTGSRSIGSHIASGYSLMFANADSGSVPDLKVAAGATGVSITQWVSSEANANLNNDRFSAMTSLNPRVSVCSALDLEVAGRMGKDAKCRQYGTSYKPTGLLHKYSVDNSMEFALFTSTYDDPRNGGALRIGMQRFLNEIDANGDFAANGIVATLNALRINKAGTGGYAGGGEGNWGNPLAEMYYEAVRYFAGKSGPTYDTAQGSIEASLGLPFLTSWNNPYSSRPWCSKPFITVISDAVTSFDSRVPGSRFESMSTESGLSGLNVSTLAQTLWDREFSSSMKNIMIGEVFNNSTAIGLPTGKDARNFDIRGVSPEEPTRQGGFYAAMLAYYARTTPLINVTVPAGKQKPAIRTFAIALSNSLPKVEVPFGNQVVRLIPYARSGSNTMSIVDYYLSPSRHDCRWPDCYQFKVNFENSEDGSDWDVDNITTYTLRKKDSGAVTVTVEATYAANGAAPHMGFIITGVNHPADASSGNRGGAYLVVREKEDDPYGATYGGYKGTSNECSANSLPYYSLIYGLVRNTRIPNCWILPERFEKDFQVNLSGSATERLRSPLWYIAKYGGYTDSASSTSPNSLLDDRQWDENGDGSPDAYLSAVNPLKLEQQLDKTFETIVATAGAQSSGAVSTARYQAGGLYFQSEVNPDNWIGNLTAYTLKKTASSVMPDVVKWSAAPLLSSASGRQIIMGRGAGQAAIPFSHASLTAVSYGNGVNGLTSQNLVNYLRGDAANEGTTTGKYRPRSVTKLGDITNSGPVYVGAPVHSTLSSYASRKAMVYIGANDGMLHGFAADDGKEVFAFIPQTLTDRLKNLSLQSYATNHEFFMDGQLSVAEAIYNGTWRTLLVGSNGRGGDVAKGATYRAGLFLLDVTDPAALTEANAANVVRWEFTSANDTRLGVLYDSAPQIVKLNDGNHYVISPNGQNSNTSGSSLFILRAGPVSSWVRSSNYYRLDASNTADSGLSAITPVDLDANGTVDLVYAGDNKGHVWKFDLSSAVPGNWTVALGGAPLFRAVGPSGLPQPIFAAPAFAVHPERGGSAPTAADPGLLLFVSTGRFLDNCDKSGSACAGYDSTQSAYGLWDYGGQICSRKELLRQRLTDVAIPGVDAGTYRQMTNNRLVYPPQSITASSCQAGTIDRTAVFDPTTSTSYAFPSFSLSDTQREAQSSYWLGWYFDLSKPQERTVSFIDYYKKRVEIQTYIPGVSSTDMCTPTDDDGYLLRINYQNGGTFLSPRFEDDTIKNAIKTNVGGASSIVGKRTGGSLGRSKILSGSRSTALMSLTVSGTPVVSDELLGRLVKRVTWREIVAN